MTLNNPKSIYHIEFEEKYGWVFVEDGEILDASPSFLWSIGQRRWNFYKMHGFKSMSRIWVERR